MISVDRVYQTVQKILNKEQRGYIPPVEFNLFVNQAMIEIFENYFYDLDAYMQLSGNDSGYADIVKNINEKISLFHNEAVIMEDANDLFAYPSNFYRLSTVFLNNVVADEVSHKESAYVNLSPLTAPTRTQPIYTRHEGGFRMSPSTMLDTDNVTLHYVRRPAEANWGYIMTGSTPTYNMSSSIDIELHPSELHNIIIKVTALAGVAVRAIDVTQIMQAEEAAYNQEIKQ